MRFEKPLGLFRPVKQGKCRRHPERVEGVEVSPGGQDFRRADQVAAGHRGNEAAVERGEKGGDFGRLLKLGVDLAAHFGVDIRYRVQKRGALICAHRFANDVQTIWNECLFCFKQFEPECMRIRTIEIDGGGL